jgi:hypothetical protein
MTDGTDGESVVLTDVAELVARRDVFPRELVYVPEWGASVWVWAYDIAAEQRRMEFMRAGAEDGEALTQWEIQTRGQVSRVGEAVRKGGELTEDGKLPPPMFNYYLLHADWLRGQPVAVLNLLCQVSERLNRETLATQEQLAAFFATMPGVVWCLKRIASASGHCTGCPRSSQATCPSVLCERLSLPIA